MTWQEKRRSSGTASSGQTTSKKILEACYIVKWSARKLANIRRSTITLVMDHQISKMRQQISAHDQPIDNNARHRSPDRKKCDDKISAHKNKTIQFSWGLVWLWCWYRPLSTAAIPCDHRPRRGLDMSRQGETAQHGGVVPGGQECRYHYDGVTTSNNAYALWCSMWHYCLNNVGAGT